MYAYNLDFSMKRKLERFYWICWLFILYWVVHIKLSWNHIQRDVMLLVIEFMKTINIITTTISGSIKDWQKMKLLEKEFQKHYFGKVSVFEFDSHKGAKEKAHELIEKGETIIVSAGGAGIS